MRLFIFSLAAQILVCFASAASTTYYLSPSGNDSNSGTSSAMPWKTIAKVNASTFRGGDALLLQGGQTFAGSINFKRSLVLSSATSHFTVGSYGTGNPTVISTGTGSDSYAISVQGVSGIVLQDLIVRPGTTSPQAGIYIRNDSGSPAPQDITVQRCDVGGFHYAPTNFGGEIFANGYWGSLTKVNILNNVLHGLSGPASPDDNGFASLGNGKNVFNLTVQGNVVYDIGGTANALGGSIGNGILANGVDGGVLQYNIVHDCGGNTTTCGGPGAIWAYSSNNVTIQYNEVYGMRPVTYTAGCDWSAYDLDGKTTNCVVQYNYSHDNFGPALLAYVDGSWGPNIFRYNISENDDYGNSDGGPISLAGTKVSGTIQIYNNTIYDGSPQSTTNGHSPLYGPYTTGTWGAGSMIKNNIFYVTNKNKYGNVDVIYFPYQPQANLVLDNNVYYVTAATARWRWGGTTYTTFASYQAGTGFDANSRTSNPQLVGPATGGTLAWNPTLPDGPQPNPSGYALQSTSLLFGLGANLGTISSGTRDYFGNAIPNGVGSGYSIGADGGASAGSDTSADVIVDNADATGVTTTGTWTASTSTTGYYGSNYWHDGNTNKGATSIQWTPTLPYDGTYTVSARWTSGTNRCASVPYQVISASGTTTVNVNQQLDGGTWVSLGSYSFTSGTTGCVKVSNAGTAGYVIVDAVRFQKAAGGGDAPVLTSIAVSPANASVQTGSNQQYSAVGMDQNGASLAQQPAFSWSVSGGGSISASGLFTSGTNAGGPYTVMASSGTVSGTSAVMVTAGPLSAIGITPVNVSVQAGGSQQYSAIAVDGYGNAFDPQPSVTWSVNGGGSMNSSGLFTSGTSVGGPYTVTVTSGTVSGTTSVMVVAGVLSAIAITPSNANVQAGSAQQFSAVAVDAFGNPLSPQPSVSWNVTGGGTINSSGLFSSGNTAGGPYTVTATSGTISGTATVAVSSGPLSLIVVSPASATVISGSTQQFTAIGKDSLGNALNPQPAFEWTVSGGGAIDGAGLFTAGSAAGGPYTVTATSGVVGGSATTSVIIVPAAPSNLSATWATMLNGWYSLTWTDNSNVESGFAIQSLSGTTWTTTGTVPANGTGYTKSGLNMPSGPYTLRVIATGSSGVNSPASNQVTFSIPTPPSMPDTLVVTTGSSSVNLSWTAVSGASNYNISRSATSGTSGFSVLKYNQNGTTYLDSSVVQGTTYWYKVCYNVSGVGASLYGSPVSVTASAPVLTSIAVAPANVSVQSGSTQQFSAVGRDQYGGTLAQQPTFNWSVSGGGTISFSGLFTSGTSAGGAYTVTAASGTVTGTASITVNTPFDLWKAAQFGAEAGNSAVSGASVANNPAGISNLMAYALGLDPFSATITQMPTTAVVSVSGTNYLALRFTRNTAATDISYLVQGSNNLSDPNGWASVSTCSGGVWSPAENVLESGSNGVIRSEVRDSLTLPTSRRFLRLEITH